MGLANSLSQHGHSVVGISRTVPKQLPKNCDHRQIDIQSDTDWSALLEGVETIVHMADGFNAFEHLCDPGDFAGLTGEMRDIAKARERLAATLNLAECAIKYGVKHFIYLSSIKAMCGIWSRDILDEDTIPNPDSLYGRLKLEAEQALFAMDKGRGMIVTALRFPIVFGSKADGNFTRLLKLANSGWPLPLSGISAQRSMISQTSLIDAIAKVVVTNPAVSDKYLVHDAAMNLPEILTNMRKGMGRSRGLYTLPKLMLEPLIYLPIIGSSAIRILRQLVLRDDRFRKVFSWVPPVGMDEELQKIAANYQH